MRPLARSRHNDALSALAARADRDFADVAGYSDLPESRRGELFAALLAAKRHFDFRGSVKGIAQDSAAKMLFAKISQSVGRTADFGDEVLGATKSTRRPARCVTPQGVKARRLLDEAGERWARLQIEAGDELPPGFAKWEAGSGFSHYGADGFIESFLRSARVMQSILQIAQDAPPKKGFAGRAVRFQHSPVEWLAGEKLPEIYCRIFRERFTATARTDVAATSNGIKFVRAACLAMGLARMEDETIRTHCRNARKGRPPRDG